LPQWQPERGDPLPLSLLKAIGIARKRGGSNEKLESVAIQSIRGAEYAPPFDTVFYYKCTFRVGPFDQRTSIILMDGTVLEPKVVGFATPQNAERNSPSDQKPEK
jgi:hypothetical protein